jgi:hypothetical protein
MSQSSCQVRFITSRLSKSTCNVQTDNMQNTREARKLLSNML